MMNYGQTSGFPETLGFIRPIGTGALWSRSGRKPFGAFRQPKLSVFGPYTVWFTPSYCHHVYNEQRLSLGSASWLIVSAVTV